MKFWDTIAKMCGVNVTKIQPGIWTTNDHGFAARESPITGGVAVRFGRLRVRVDELGSHRSRVTVGDRMWELTDTTEASAVITPHRIGLIAIERIRPMNGKRADLEGACRGAQSRIEQAAIDRLNLS